MTINSNPKVTIALTNWDNTQAHNKERILTHRERDMIKKMAKRKTFLIANCLLVFLAIYKEAQAQLFGFDLGNLGNLAGSGSGSDSDNECYVQCPMECPQLNLDMVDCVVYCKMKCACAADDSDCITKAMDKMQKAADERESAIGPDEEAAAAESPTSSDAPSGEPDEEATDGFETEDGERGLPPGAMAPEIDTTSSVIEMELSPTSADVEAPESQGPSAATPLSAPAPESQGPSAATPLSAPSPSSQGPSAATPQSATAPTPQNAASPGQQKANAPAPV